MLLLQLTSTASLSLFCCYLCGFFSAGGEPSDKRQRIQYPHSGVSCYTVEDPQQSSRGVSCGSTQRPRHGTRQADTFDRFESRVWTEHMSGLSRTLVLHLYRSLLKHAKKLQDYNFRSYAIRRTRQGFREAKRVSPEEAERLYQSGLKQLEVVNRQAIISSLFPGMNSVLAARKLTNL